MIFLIFWIFLGFFGCFRIFWISLDCWGFWDFFWTCYIFWIFFELLGFRESSEGKITSHFYGIFGILFGFLGFSGCFRNLLDLLGIFLISIGFFGFFGFIRGFGIFWILWIFLRISQKGVRYFFRVIFLSNVPPRRLTGRAETFTVGFWVAGRLRVTKKSYFIPAHIVAPQIKVIALSIRVISALAYMWTDANMIITWPTTK